MRTLHRTTALFARFRALADGPSFGALDAVRRKVVENALRDFRLGGAELSDADKARFKAVQEALATLSSTFDDNVLDSENAWAHYVEDEHALAGVPADVIAVARAAAEADGRAGYKLTLRYPCYMPVMQYAEDRSLRALVHRAAATLASDLGVSPAWDNTAIIARILELRCEEARLLGYANFAELSLVPKMAETPASVLAFLHDLARRARPFAERDYADLAAFAQRKLGIRDLAAWDLAYVAEKLKAERFAFSEQEVRQYFPEDRVLAGLFRVVETRCSTCCCIANTCPAATAGIRTRRRCSTPRGARSLSCRVRRTTGSCTVSATSSQGGTRPVTTATSGPRCCRRTRSACSRSAG